MDAYLTLSWPLEYVQSFAMTKIIKSTPTGKGEVKIYRSGIMHQTYEDNVELYSKDSQAEFEIYRKEYCQKTPRPILVDIRNIKSVSRESRNIYSSQETGELLSAAALLIGNPVSRIIGNFYLGINKTVMPVRMFTSDREAGDWLKNYLPR